MDSAGREHAARGAARRAGAPPGGWAGDWMPGSPAGFRSGRDARGRTSPRVRNYCLTGAPAFFCRKFVSAPIRSIGIGKIVVELFSVAISASVCR